MSTEMYIPGQSVYSRNIGNRRICFQIHAKTNRALNNPAVIPPSWDLPGLLGGSSVPAAIASTMLTARM
jgi:hypothetical protein